MYNCSMYLKIFRHYAVTLACVWEIHLWDCISCKPTREWAKTEQIFEKKNLPFFPCQCVVSSRAKKHENLFLYDSREAREIHTALREEEKMVKIEINAAVAVRAAKNVCTLCETFIALLKSRETHIKIWSHDFVISKTRWRGLWGTQRIKAKQEIERESEKMLKWPAGLRHTKNAFDRHHPSLILQLLHKRRYQGCIACVYSPRVSSICFSSAICHVKCEKKII